MRYEVVAKSVFMGVGAWIIFGYVAAGEDKECPVCHVGKLRYAWPTALSECFRVVQVCLHCRGRFFVGQLNPGMKWMRLVAVAVVVGDVILRWMVSAGWFDQLWVAVRGVVRGQ
jgi:hypothetical protein